MSGSAQHFALGYDTSDSSLWAAPCLDIQPNPSDIPDIQALQLNLSLKKAGETSVHHHFLIPPYPPFKAKLASRAIPKYSIPRQELARR